MYNVHSLVHLAYLSERHGRLDSFSAFKFEKPHANPQEVCKSTSNPLAQVLKRSSEASNTAINVSVK